MKKLEKMSLIQLAEVMPVICENEQKCCVGGTEYFAMTSSGIKYLGPIADGCDEVRFRDDAPLGSGSNPDDLYKNSKSIDEMNINTGNNISAESIGRAYCSSKGLSVNFQNVVYAPVIDPVTKVTKNVQVSASYSPSSDTINLSKSQLSDYITNGSFSQFSTIVTHESGHRQTHSTISNNAAYSSLDSYTKKMIEELAGLAAQINAGVPNSYKPETPGSTNGFTDLCNYAIFGVKDNVETLSASDLSNYNTVKKFYTDYVRPIE